MSTDSLKEVIEQLKKEGIEAAKKEVEKIIQDAEAKAEDIIIDAEMKAKKITNQANSEAKKTKEQLEIELERAAKTALGAFKSSIEKALVVPTIQEALASQLESPQFMEKVLLEMVKGFVSSGFKNSDLTIILPETMQNNIGAAFLGKIKMLTASKAVNVEFDDSISFGFKIGPSGEGYVYDFSDNGLIEIFAKFISPKFRDLFYNKENQD